MADESSRTIQESSGVRQFQTILHWQHKNGPAHCLLRVHLPRTGPALAIVSDIRSNDETRDTGSEFPAVADTALAALPPDVEVDPRTVTWFEHYGEFSSYDSYSAPEGFARITLTWDGTRYHGGLADIHILKRNEWETLLAGVSLAPVPDVVRELGWTY